MAEDSSLCPLIVAQWPESCTRELTCVKTHPTPVCEGGGPLLLRAEVDRGCMPSDLAEVGAQVQDHRLQALVAEEQLDPADVQAALQPAFRVEATEVVQRVAVAPPIAQSRGGVP